MSKRKQTMLGAGLLGLAAAVIFTFTGRGSLQHTSVVLALIFGIAIPMVLLGLLALWLGRYYKAFLMGWVATLFFSIAIIVFVQLVTLLTGGLVYNHDVKAAQQYCESLIPVLDNFKSRHKYYPWELGLLDYDSTLPFPLLLHLGTFYQSKGNSFRFYFSDPSIMMGSYEYSNETRKWEHFIH